MTSVRSAKVKGSSFEYDVQYSLKFKYPSVYLTKQQGFQQQQDVRSDIDKFTIECKRLRAISWNEAVKIYEKLKLVTPQDYDCYLIFQSNRQPALVMGKGLDGCHFVLTFEHWFGIPFLKHESTRAFKKKI
jgi:hypothetical protein